MAAPRPRLSIVVINYNYAHFLPRSLSSALGQDVPGVEVIVVDDVSTDNSREVIAGFGDRVTAVLHPENRGHGGGMNSGFAAARGELVMFLDADDFLHPQAARRILDHQADGVAQYQHRLDLVDAGGTKIDVFPPWEVAWDDGDVRETVLSSGRYATTVTSGLAFSRKALEQILPMPEASFRQAGDGYLVTVAPLYGSVASIDEVLGAYRQHGGNHSQFAGAVAQRARWRAAQDQMRYDALRDHAGRLGLAFDPKLWRRDLYHLEERMASLLLDPKQHPYAGDRRADLARCGMAACDSMGVSARRRLTMKLWWLTMGFGPPPVARAAVSWKLQVATRPRFVRLIAKGFRRATS